MHFSGPFWVWLTLGCTLVLLAGNFSNSAAWTSFRSPRTATSLRSFMHAQPNETLSIGSPSHLVAFVGVFTGDKPDRRRALRSTWFPSSEAALNKSEDWKPVVFAYQCCKSRKQQSDGLCAGLRLNTRSDFDLLLEDFKTPMFKLQLMRSSANTMIFS